MGIFDTLQYVTMDHYVIQQDANNVIFQMLFNFQQNRTSVKKELIFQFRLREIYINTYAFQFLLLRSEYSSIQRYLRTRN